MTRGTSYLEEKEGRCLAQSYEKSLLPTGMSKGQCDNTKTSPKSSITQRFRTDMTRSDGVTTVIQLVWLTCLRTQHSHSP